MVTEHVLVHLYGDESVFSVIGDCPGVLRVYPEKTTPDDVMFLAQALKNPGIKPANIPVWDGKPLDSRIRKTYSGKHGIGKIITEMTKSPEAKPQVVVLENIERHVDQFLWYVQEHENGTVLHRGHGNLRDDDLPATLTIDGEEISPVYLADDRIQRAIMEQRLALPLNPNTLSARAHQRFFTALATLCESVPVIMTGLETAINEMDGTIIRWQPASHIARLLYYQTSITVYVERGALTQHNHGGTIHTPLERDTLYDILDLPYVIR